MEYILSTILTVLVAFGIINMLGNKIGISKTKEVFRQSDKHLVLKHFISEQPETRIKMSQLQQRFEQDRVRIVSIEDKAYWVKDNVFYVAELTNDAPDMSTAQPIDTSRMSKDDVDKMLFILDNLGGGKNERGSTGN